MTSRQQGFSLLELLVVLAVIAIIASISAMMLVNARQRGQLNDASRTVSETLQRVAEDARRQSRRIDIDENALANQGELVWSSGSLELGRIALPEVADISFSKQVAGEGIWFTGRGVASQQVSFTITAHSLSDTVTLLPTGMVVH